MRVYEATECARHNFGKCINQLHSKTNALVRKLELIIINLYR